MVLCKLQRELPKKPYTKWNSNTMQHFHKHFEDYSHVIFCLAVCDLLVSDQIVHSGHNEVWLQRCWEKMAFTGGGAIRWTKNWSRSRGQEREVTGDSSSLDFLQNNGEIQKLPMIHRMETIRRVNLGAKLWGTLVRI